MVKKLAVVTIGVAAGLAAAAPLASAQEASHAGTTHTTSSSPAVQAPVEQDAVAGVLDHSNGDLGSNGDSLSGNATFLNGHDLSL